MLPMQGMGVLSLVGELGSHMPHGVAKKFFFNFLTNKNNAKGTEV